MGSGTVIAQGSGMAPRTSVSIVANGGRTLCGFSRTASLGQASLALDAAGARLWSMGQTEDPSVIVCVGTVSAEFSSLAESERGLASMFDEHAQTG